MLRSFVIAASSLEKHAAEVRAVDRDMTHCARLILQRLVVRRAGRALYRNAMALQAHEVDLVYTQQPRVG